MTLKMIVPVDVNDAVLVASNIAETDYTAWNSGTAYIIGDRVIVVSTHSIYEAIAAGTNHDPVADTALETPLWWVRVGATNKWRAFDGVIQDQAVKTGGITYELDLTSRADGIALFNLDAESVTVQVSDPLTPRVNLISATDDLSTWTDVPGSFIGGTATDPDGGSTAIIIDFPGSSNPDYIIKASSAGGNYSEVTMSAWLRSDVISAVTFDIAGLSTPTAGVVVNISNTWQRYSVTGVNLNGDGTPAFQIENHLEIAGIVEIWHPQLELGDTATNYQAIDASDNITSFAYETTKDLQDYSGIEDYWTYFFNGIDRLSDVVFEDVPAFSGTTVYISINSSDDAKVGEIALGQNFLLGKTHAGASVGIQDFSRKERDTFGNWVIIERSYADTMDVNFSFDASRVAYTRRTLADRRAQPTVFHAGETNEQFGLLAYGFYKDINFPIVTRDLCVASLEIEGLT